MAEKRQIYFGIVPIKEEYLVKTTSEEVPSKKLKLDRVGKKRKGQFKKRQNKNKLQIDTNQTLCSSLIDVPEDLTSLPKCDNADCKLSHDFEKYLQNKPPDIGSECFSFKTKGHCPWGVTCRFSKNHTTESGRNLKCPDVMAEYEKNGLKCVNFMNKELKSRLRKKTYDFSKSLEIVESIVKENTESEEGCEPEEACEPEKVCEPEEACEPEKVCEPEEACEPEKVCEPEDGFEPEKVCEPEEACEPEKVCEPEDGFEPEKMCEPEDGFEPEKMCEPEDGFEPEKMCEPEDGFEPEKMCESEDGFEPEKMCESEDGFEPERNSEPEGKGCKPGKGSEPENGKEVANGNGYDKPLGPCPDEDIIKLKQEEKKKIDWTGKLYLSPLTTLGNLPFRRICKEFGADITCAEMTMAPSLLQCYQYEWALIKRHQSEDLFGVQVCGNNPAVLTKCAQLLEETVALDFVDINLGCPTDMVYEKGSGSGLLRREKVLSSVVHSMSQILSIPLTVKTRTGVYADKNVAHKFIPLYKSAGVSLITVHGRSREQRFTKRADWNYINECAKEAKPIPVFGNGDVLSFSDYHHKMTTYDNISGVMIGRGALYKPWIFTEIKEQRDWDISSSERFEIIKKYINYGLDHWGSDTKGVEITRKFALEWLSFLYRYIPVGLLEHPPQRINERPPKYMGRDTLETLMASPKCSDWIKITEMILGPVPENFQFLPKHKANAWET